MSTRTVVSTDEEFILRSLSRCVRLLSFEQVARIAGVTPTTVRRRVRSLSRAGLVQEREVLAQMLEAIRPLATWRPGSPLPDPTQVSRLANERFTGCPLRHVRAIQATPRTLSHYGLGRRAEFKREQQTHDLGLSEAFLYFLGRWPQLTRRWWVGEDVFRAERDAHEKIEDAQLRDPRSGEAVLAIEFTGKYKPPRVAAFIEEMSQRELPFMCF